MKILIESMTKVQIQELSIRCWRQEEKQPEPVDYNDLKNQVIEIYDSLPFDSEISYHDMAEKILQINRMNAVEIINESGDGIVLYANWP